MRLFRACVVLGLVLHLCAAWFNEGFSSPDEHFQILEFGIHKLGLVPATDLAWEFHEKMRPAIQPAVVYGTHRALTLAGVENPFLLTFLLRLTSALLGFAMSTALCVYGLRVLADERAKTLLVLATFGSYFNPYLHARFSSENWAGLFFFGGVFLLLIARDGLRRNTLWLPTFAAGAVFGVAFWCRFQMGFALAGVALWLILVRRIRPSAAVAGALGFLLASAGNVALDRWFYGQWVLTPVRYFVANIVEARAALMFGTQPWHFYLDQLFVLLIPPFSIVCLVLLAVACYRFRAHLLVWSVIPFLVGHTLVAHKEIRFLVPMIYALPLLLAFGADSVAGRTRRWMSTRVYVWAWKGLLGVNVVLLLVMTFKPAMDSAPVFKWMYHKGQQGEYTLYAFGRNPYSSPVPFTFYTSSRATVVPVNDSSELVRILRSSAHPVYVFAEGFTIPQALQSPALQWHAEVRTFQPWLRRFNLNNWLSRVQIWNIYRCSLAGA